jgi:hypothetical protein
MKSLKSSWKVYLAAILGFVVGFGLFHSRIVNAQYSGYVVVQRAEYILTGDIQRNIKGSQVVGFSCIQTDNGAECYVASK